MSRAQVITWLSVGAMAVSSFGGSAVQGVQKAVEQATSETTEAKETQPADFIEAVRQSAQRLNTKPEYLLAAMSFETAGTLDPTIKGVTALDGTRATGLIQFMPDTAKELGTSSAEIAQMDKVEQVLLAEKYFTQRGFVGGGLQQLYSTIFAGHPNASSTISDGYHTLGEAVARIEREHLPRAKEILRKDDKLPDDDTRGSGR